MECEKLTKSQGILSSETTPEFCLIYVFSLTLGNQACVSKVLIFWLLMQNVSNTKSEYKIER